MTLGKFIRIGAAALGALTVSMNADAADMNGYGGYKGGPGYAGVNWSGLYIGANGGYGWRDTSDQFAYAACAGLRLSSLWRYRGGRRLRRRSNRL